MKPFRTTPACIRSWSAAFLVFFATARTHAAEGTGMVVGERTRDAGRILPLTRLQWVVTLTNVPRLEVTAFVAGLPAVAF